MNFCRCCFFAFLTRLLSFLSFWLVLFSKASASFSTFLTLLRAEASPPGGPLCFTYFSQVFGVFACPQLSQLRSYCSPILLVLAPTMARRSGRKNAGSKLSQVLAAETTESASDALHALPSPPSSLPPLPESVR